MEQKIDLSIIILNYNTKTLLKNCLNSLKKVSDEASLEIIVIDNGSTDGSVEMVAKEFLGIKLIENEKNLGFAAGNNLAKAQAKGEYVLFLNSDTLMEKNVLATTLSYLRKNPEVGALTCKLVLANGELDKDARRSFPTPWVSLTHLILKLDRIFPKSKIFAKYWYGYKSPDEVHEVDALQGAFFLVRKKILDEAGWFDEDYFLDGEDIDLSWRIKQKGWKIIYFPKVTITHIKGASKGKNEIASRKVALKERLAYRMAGMNSMEIFYKKHLWERYPLLLNFAVLLGIKAVKLGRFLKTIISK